MGEALIEVWMLSPNDDRLPRTPRCMCPWLSALLRKPDSAYLWLTIVFPGQLHGLRERSVFVSRSCRRQEGLVAECNSPRYSSTLSGSKTSGCAFLLKKYSFCIRSLSLTGTIVACRGVLCASSVVYRDVYQL